MSSSQAPCPCSLRCRPILTLLDEQHTKWCTCTLIPCLQPCLGVSKPGAFGWLRGWERNLLNERMTESALTVSDWGMMCSEGFSGIWREVIPINKPTRETSKGKLKGELASLHSHKTMRGCLQVPCTAKQSRSRGPQPLTLWLHCSSNGNIHFTQEEGYLQKGLYRVRLLHLCV